jgi:hypothetical protein
MILMGFSAYACFGYVSRPSIGYVSTVAFAACRWRCRQATTAALTLAPRRPQTVELEPGETAVHDRRFQ